MNEDLPVNLPTVNRRHQNEQKQARTTQPGPRQTHEANAEGSFIGSCCCLLTSLLSLSGPAQLISMKQVHTYNAREHESGTVCRLAKEAPTLDRNHECVWKNIRHTDYNFDTNSLKSE